MMHWRPTSDIVSSGIRHSRQKPEIVNVSSDFNTEDAFGIGVHHYNRYESTRNAEKLHCSSAESYVHCRLARKEVRKY